MKIIKILFFILFLFVLIVLDSSQTLANSAQTSFSGVDATGAIIQDEQSPLVVEKELLVFDLAEFPANHYSNKEDFLAYGGKVTANYTIYNPSEYNITAKLLFPFGKTPNYAEFEEKATDESKYEILLDGKTVNKKIRYSFSNEYEQFKLEEDLGRLSDEIIVHSFYNPNLAVTKYTYNISEVDTEAYPSAVVACDFLKTANSRIYMPNFEIFENMDDNVRVGSWLRNYDSEITIYILGEEQTPKLQFYKNGQVLDEEVIDGSITLKSRQNLTFKDLIMEMLPDSTIMENDWYNAVVNKIIEEENGFGYTLVDVYFSKNDLLRWYEYEIAIPAKQRLINSVTAPMYPLINVGWSPPYYGYTYLLSPAKTWKSFNNLEIVINTSYHLSNSSLGNFSKTENGYRLSLDKLPDKELNFTLCASENPNRVQKFNSMLWVIVICLILMAVLTLLPIVAILVILFKKKPS